MADGTQLHLRYRLPLLLAVVAVTAVAWPVSQRLTFDRSIESLYAADNPYLRDYRESKELFGGDEFVIVTYTDPELLNDKRRLTESSRGRLTELTESLNAVEGVRAASTQDLRGVMRAVIPIGKALELSRGILLGNDDATTAVVLRLEPEQAADISRDATISAIRQRAAAFGSNHQLDVYVVGEPVQVNEMFRYVEEDGRVLFYVSLACLGLVLLALFRSWRWMLLPLLVVVVTIRWTEAALVLSGVKLSMVSSMLNSLVTIIGVATVTHIAVYYQKQRLEHDRIDGFHRTWTALRPPVVWACLTTGVGFASLLSSHITPVRSFGAMISLAVLMTLFVMSITLPGGILTGRFASDPRTVVGDRHLVTLLQSITRTTLKRPRTYGAIFAAIIAVGGLGLLRLQVETDFSKNFRADSPIVRSLAFFEDDRRLGGAGTWEVNFPAPPALTESYLNKVRKLAARLRQEFVAPDSSGELTKVLAITDGLDAAPEIPFVPISIERKLDLLALFQPEFVTSLYNPEAGRMRIVLRARERQSAELKLALIDRVRQVTQSWAEEQLADEFPQPVAKASGLFVLLAFLIESLLADQLVSFGIAAVGIAGMLTIAFRSLRIGLAALVPNVFPIVLVIGSLGWTGLPINIATAMIASVSMGLTVDSSIHYLSGFRRARNRGLSVADALEETHGQVGRALVYANIALIAGFSVLTLSHFIPLIYFGVLVSAAMLGGLIGNLFLLPLLLSWAEKEANPTIG